MTPLQETALAFLALGFVIAVLLIDLLLRVQARRAKRRRIAYHNALMEALEAPGLCPHCWGDCPRSGCVTPLQSAALPEPSDDEYDALVVQFPALTARQLRTVATRRAQERAS